MSSFSVDIDQNRWKAYKTDLNENLADFSVKQIDYAIALPDKTCGILLVETLQLAIALREESSPTQTNHDSLGNGDLLFPRTVSYWLVGLHKSRRDAFDRWLEKPFEAISFLHLFRTQANEHTPVRARNS